MEAFKQFSRLASGVDVLHYHFPWPFADVLHLASKIDTPSILTYHSDIVRQKWLGRLYSPLMWRTLRQMRCIIATSPAYLETSPVLSHPSIRDKVRVIPLGIDEDSYPEASEYNVFHRKGLDITEPYFLFIGVLRYYKGVHFLIKAAKGLGAKVVIAGTGPEEANLKALATENGASNVIFVGRISDPEKVALLKHCKALVLPSHLRSEAFGMVQVEAQMFSRPLISCEIGTGTSFVNKNEKTGFVVAPSSPELLHEAMRNILLHEQLAEALGHEARLRYQNLFSSEALGRAYHDLYTELET